MAHRPYLGPGPTKTERTHLSNLWKDMCLVLQRPWGLDLFSGWVPCTLGLAHCPQHLTPAGPRTLSPGPLRLTPHSSPCALGGEGAGATLSEAGREGCNEFGCSRCPGPSFLLFSEAARRPAGVGLPFSTVSL